MLKDARTPQHIALIRTDKIGDLVSTLPVDQAMILEPRFNHSFTTWIIDKTLKSVVENSEPKRNFFCIDRTQKWQSFLALQKWFKENQIDCIIIFYAPWWVALAALLSGVVRRIGRKSQWHSFLFLNQGIRQSRSQSEKHEADYNWDLILESLNIPKKSSAPILKLQTPFRRDLLEKWALQSKAYVVVHAGMAGSALNWPLQNYNSLITELVHRKITVVITGTQADEPWLKDLKPQWQKHPEIRWLQNVLDFESLLYILANSRAVVAPSTGVAHLAASLGAPLVSIFPPVRAQSEKRWGPRGIKENSVITLKPQVERDDLPAEQYVQDNVMAQVTVTDVLNALKV